MTFGTYMKEVDKILEAKIGLDHEDMTDWHWMDSYEDGETPREAVADFMEDEGMGEFA